MTALVPMSIDYQAVADNTRLADFQAEHLLERPSCLVIRHRARVIVEYLVENADGTRTWVRAAN